MSSRSRAAPRNTSNNLHYGFDTTSGQCFAEFTVKARPRRHLSLLQTGDRAVHRSHEGCPTLETIALRQFLYYVEDVTPELMDELVELLSHLPWTIGNRIWKSAQNL